jgi:hypothetical protein
MGCPSKRAPPVRIEEGPARRSVARRLRAASWEAVRVVARSWSSGSRRILVLFVLTWMPRGGPWVWKVSMMRERLS